MCSGHAVGVHWIDLEVLGMLGNPWGSLGVPLGSFGCLLGGPWVPWRPWERPGIVLGGPWGDFGGLGRSSDQSWEVVF